MEMSSYKTYLTFRKFFTRFAERSVRFNGGKFDTAVFKKEVRDFCYNTLPHATRARVIDNLFLRRLEIGEAPFYLFPFARL